MINVTKPSLPPYEEYINEIKTVWGNTWLTNFGPLEQKLTASLKDFLGVNEAVLFVNGHQALYSVLSVLGLKGEVITTPFTFASTTHAIAQAGLTPVFADVKSDDFTLDPEKVEALINEKTAAILPVHVYGNVCDVEAFEKISKKYNIPVIYDAAHAFGVKINGKSVLNYGTASMLSFHATKIYNSVEGGAVVFNDKSLEKKLKQFANFGIVDGEKAEKVGTNAKMSEFSAAMGICNLRHIGEYIEKRAHVFDLYKQLLSENVETLNPQTGVNRNYAYFPVFLKDNESRDRVQKALKDDEIFARRYFYPLTSQFDCYRACTGADNTPIAKSISERVLCLPFYADLEDENVQKIAETVNREA